MMHCKKCRPLQDNARLANSSTALHPAAGMQGDVATLQHSAMHLNNGKVPFALCVADWLPSTHL